MAKGFIGTKLQAGQGFGNQLFCYITIRCLAEQKHYDYSILNSELLQHNLLTDNGSFFMDLSYGDKIPEEQFTSIYHEKEDRIYLGNSLHDIKNGVYISGVDNYLLSETENLLIEGNLQDSRYFCKYKAQIKEWLKVEDPFDSMEFYKDNLCIINIRGGEYCSSPELYLNRKYYLNAIKCMRKIQEEMEFVIITDSVADAHRILPEYPVYHFSVYKDYVTIKNAKYLILSNSSFAFFAAYTSDTVKYIIAPKYWARYNVSDGYWASEQNIYDEFMYMNKSGKLLNAQDCRIELQKYKQISRKYARINQVPGKVRKLFYQIEAKNIRIQYFLYRAVRSIKRRMTRKQYDI